MAAGGLAVVAPGLPEAEVLVGGTIAVTVLRSVGWLARMDVGTRPIPAGPGLPTPGAQGLGTLGATLALLPTPVEGRARDAELGLWAGPAGPAPLVGPGRSLLEVDPPGAVLSALKMPEDGSGVILRLLNPTDRPMEATVTVGFPANEVMPVRLDETPAGEATALAGDVVRLRLRPHGLETVLLR